MKTAKQFLSICRSLRLLLLVGTTLTGVVSMGFAETVTVTDITGTKFTGELGTWSEKNLTLTGENPREFEWSIVRSVTFDEPPRKMTHSNSMLSLSNGDRIAAGAVKTADDFLVITWPALGTKSPPKIPLDKVTAIILDLPVAVNERMRLMADLETLPPGSDVVLLGNGDRSQGEFESLGPTFVELKGPASVLRIDRGRVRAIRLNPELTTRLRPSARRTIVTLKDGSRLSSSDLVIANRQLTMKSQALGELTLPLDVVTACELFGDRVTAVSDYEPVKVEFTPYLSTAWQLARNTNVLRGPLVVRGAESVTGLGMHSRMSVTYQLRGNEVAFQSKVGIDDAANGAGSVEFAVELDGRRVWTSAHLNGKSRIVSVPEVALWGAKQITLLVDYGQFADVSDYADWCDAVFILDQPK